MNYQKILVLFILLISKYKEAKLTRYKIFSNKMFVYFRLRSFSERSRYTKSYIFTYKATFRDHFVTSWASLLKHIGMDNSVGLQELCFPVVL